MRIRPISVLPSATTDVAECHKINTQSTYLRQFRMEVVHSTSHNQCGGFGVNYFCKRYANLFTRRIQLCHADKSRSHNQRKDEQRMKPCSWQPGDEKAPRQH